MRSNLYLGLDNGGGGIITTLQTQNLKKLLSKYIKVIFSIYS